jgi:hypothetical protein
MKLNEERRLPMNTNKPIVSDDLEDLIYTDTWHCSER